MNIQYQHIVTYQGSRKRYGVRKIIKASYTIEEAAYFVSKDSSDINFYICPVCGYIHIATKNIT
jgi:rubrerythrin